jgi:hypothetical protein
MNTNTKLIISAALLALLTAPASARIDGDDGGASAFPRFKDRTHMTQVGGTQSPSSHLVNRPFHQR